MSMIFLSVDVFTSFKQTFLGLCVTMINIEHSKPRQNAEK
jgi:hypothetical protein